MSRPMTARPDLAAEAEADGRASGPPEWKS
jgi:hypothetical protein